MGEEDTRKKWRRNACRTEDRITKEARPSSIKGENNFLTRVPIDGNTGLSKNGGLFFRESVEREQKTSRRNGVWNTVRQFRG